MFLQIGLDSLLLSLFAFYLLLLLLHKLGGDSPDVVLGATQVFPQLPQEHSSVLWVQEAGQVDLHLLGVREPWLQLVVDKLYEYVVLDPQELRDALCDPRLYCVHINFRHVNLFLQSIIEFH